MHMNVYLSMYAVRLTLSQQKQQIEVAPGSIERNKNAAHELGTSE